MAWSKNQGKLAKENGEYAKLEGDKAKDAAKSVEIAIANSEKVTKDNKTRFLNAVATVALRDSVYPNPQHGDTVRVTNPESDGLARTYRFVTGTGWVITDVYNPTAIDNVTAQLADTAKKSEVQSLVVNKAEKTYVDTLAASLASGSPKGTYATLAALQTTFPTGNSNIYVVSADGKWYFWNGSVWTAGGTYQSTGIANSSVKVTNLDFTKNSLNLFDGNYKIDVALAVASTPWKMLTATGGRVAVIPVVGGDTYYIRKFDTSDRFRIAGTIAEPTFTAVGINVDYTYVNSFSSTNEKIVTTSDVKFLVIHVSSNSETPRLNVIQGEDKTEFVPYKVIDSQYIERLPVKKSLLDDELKSVIYRNKYFINEWELGELRVSDGVGLSSSNRVRTDFIEVSKGTKIKFLDQVNTAGVYIFRYSLETKAFLGTVAYTYEYQVTEDCYIRMVSKYNDNRTISSPTEFNQKCQVVMNEPYITPSSKPYLFGDFTSRYTSLDCVDKTSILPTESSNSLYSRYDDLLNSNSDIMTKNLLGYASDSNGIEDTTLPIYEYVIKPPKNWKAIPLNKTPKILITSGVHGNEKSSTESTYEFIKQLLQNYDTNETLASIKSNVEFRIIPILNVGGYTDSTRNNRHGVDINRNLSYKWAETVSAVKGTSMYSEPESKVLRDWLVANKDAALYIDYHNTGEEYGVSYFNTPDLISQKIYSSVIRRLTDYWYKHYNFSRDVAQGWIANDAIPCTFNEAIYAAKIKQSAILEIAWDYNKVYYSKEVTQRGVDLLVNYLASYLHQYNLGIDD